MKEVTEMSHFIEDCFHEIYKCISNPEIDYYETIDILLFNIGYMVSNNEKSVAKGLKVFLFSEIDKKDILDVVREITVDDINIVQQSNDIELLTTTRNSLEFINIALEYLGLVITEEMKQAFEHFKKLNRPTYNFSWVAEEWQHRFYY